MKLTATASRAPISIAASPVSRLTGGTVGAVPDWFLRISCSSWRVLFSRRSRRSSSRSSVVRPSVRYPGVALGLRQPVPDGLGRWLKLLGGRFRRAALTYQFNDPLPEL